MREARERLVAAHHRFAKLDDDPRKYYDKAIRLSWWDLMNALAAAERIVWRLFVGDRPTRESNMQFAKWRADYLAGKNVKVDA